MPAPASMLTVKPFLTRVAVTAGVKATLKDSLTNEYNLTTIQIN